MANRNTTDVIIHGYVVWWMFCSIMKYIDEDVEIEDVAVGGKINLYNNKCGRLRPHFVLGQGEIHEQ